MIQNAPVDFFYTATIYPFLELHFISFFFGMEECWRFPQLHSHRKHCHQVCKTLKLVEIAISELEKKTKQSYIEISNVSIIISAGEERIVN